ncbi:endo-1,4-beta-xylanase [Mucisphaera calidilacus]|uniref:Beta-xylanase n=1 Tax=Mucisphaera calidilacus TaxID=2527982 RepID=A0A518BUD0_9BACT|nr:endo-1,4-beta-xylanase [Mucisphaera calidilacus]QDU70551.1 Endo-1,4-beta-xylanase/feruloyl esterase precursor [Mucisphaera calidilacus]
MPAYRLLALLLIVVMAAPSFAQNTAENARHIGIARQPILGGEAASDARLEMLRDDQTDGHGHGFRLTTVKQPAHHYSIEVRFLLDAGFKAGDVVHATFWARSRDAARYETSEALTLFRVQRTGPPWERTLYREWSVGPHWRKCTIASRVDKDIPAGQIAAVFSGGYPRQAIEVAGLTITNYGPDADPDTLEQSTFEYVGMEPDAPWRRDALERIEKHRKAEIPLRVVDRDGRPVPNARVEAILSRHDFDFGVAISATWLNENWDTPEGRRYREELTRNFNAVAIENALKWSWWEREPETALRTLDWLHKETDLRIHGHVLVWPGLEKFRTTDAQPLWEAAQKNPDMLRARIDAHMQSVLLATRGMIDVWDVVNEAYNQNEIIHLLGDEMIVHWFQRARRFAPKATLIYNDFALLGQSGRNKIKQQFVYDLVKKARDAGAPIDAIGLQAHLGSSYTPPERVLAIIDKFAELDVNIQITEYDISIIDPVVAEQYTRDLMIAVFSHPAVTTFQGWNYWSATPTWMPEAAYFADDWSLQPIGRAYVQLVQNEWQTHEKLRTNRQGVARLRGFKGDYDVHVLTPDGRQSLHAVRLSDDNTAIDLVVE